MRKILAGIVLGLVVFVGTSNASPLLPIPEMETLPNGLQVAWFLNESMPLVDLSVLVHAGYRDDPIGKSGALELVAATLDRGTSESTATQIARSVEKLGGLRFVLPENDTLLVGLHGLSTDALELLKTLGKLVLHPTFPEKELRRERDHVLERWRPITDQGDGLVALAYHRIMTAGTIYGRGSFASIREFERISQQDLKEFHKRFFTPKNSILMVVGRVNRAEFKEKVLSVFGSWQGEKPKTVYQRHSNLRIEQKVASKINQDKPSIVVIDRPPLNQAQVRIGFRAPKIQVSEHPALVVANAILGEYFNSRLSAIIREQLGLTYSIGSSFAYSQELVEFTISTTARNAMVGPIIEKVFQILKELRETRVSASELDLAKNYLKGKFPVTVTTLQAMASRWLGGYLAGLGPNYLNEYVGKIEAVTPEQIQTVARKYYDLRNSVVVVVGNAQAIHPSLVQAHFKSIKPLTVLDLKE